MTNALVLIQVYTFSTQIRTDVYVKTAKYNYILLFVLCKNNVLSLGALLTKLCNVTVIKPTWLKAILDVNA